MNKPKTIFLIALHPQKFPFIGESHGICAISGFLKERYPHTVKTKLYDQQIDSNSQIIKDILEYKPSLIGLSLKMYTFSNFVTLYRIFEETVFPVYRPHIILGNSVAHFSGEDILMKYGYHDVIISLGEGEVSWEDLVQYNDGEINISDVRNIIYYSNGKSIRTKFEYLDNSLIPIADRTRTLEFYQAGGEVYIEASRGCNYCGCSICECRDFLGSRSYKNKWRDKSIDNIIQELCHLKSIGISEVTFSDEDFFGDDSYGIKRALLLTSKIEHCGINISFRINARVHTIYDKYETEDMKILRTELLVALKRAGLSKVFLGFESGVQSQLSRYNKGFSLSEFEVAKSRLEKIGINYELGYISIDPLMSRKELLESLNYIRTNNCIPYISSIYKKLRIQKGNKLYIRQIRQYEERHKQKILGDLMFNEQMFEIVGFADKDIALICSLMDEYESHIYKLYYRFRILTQYDKNIERDKTYLALVFQTMERLKYNDYNLLYELASTQVLSKVIGRKIVSNYNYNRSQILKLFLRDYKFEIQNKDENNRL